MIWIIIFGIVLANNLIPIFGPPTWLVLSFAAVYYHIDNVLLLALIGAVAATLGRLILAKLSDTLIRRRFLSEKYQRSIDDLKKYLEQKRGVTFSVFLLYAFSPFPSSQLFIAYGLTEAPLKLIAFPFFIGRLVSYSILAFTSLEVSKKIASQSLRSGSFFSFYFIFSQLLALAALYFFVKIDWHKLLTEHKLRLIK